MVVRFAAACSRCRRATVARTRHAALPASLAVGLPLALVWLDIVTRNAVSSAAAPAALALFAFRRRGGTEADRRSAPDPDDDSDGSSSSEDQAADVADPAELTMPRWRRPSLMAARVAPAGGSLALIEAERLTFARGTTSPGAVERRRVRYRMVRMSDRPDELRSTEIGRLDEDDEVELLESHGAYWKVRTPFGEEGWVHRTTLGDPITAADLRRAGPSPDPQRGAAAGPGARTRAGTTVPATAPGIAPLAAIEEEDPRIALLSTIPELDGRVGSDDSDDRIPADAASLDVLPPAPAAWARLMEAPPAPDDAPPSRLSPR